MRQVRENLSEPEPNLRERATIVTPFIAVTPPGPFPAS